MPKYMHHQMNFLNTLIIFMQTILTHITCDDEP